MKLLLGVAATLVTALVCAAPWAFGCMDPHFQGATAAAVLGVCGATLLAAAWLGAPEPGLPRAALWLAAGVAAVALLPAVPLPHALRSLLSPEGERLLASVGAAGEGALRAVSLAPRSTLLAAATAASAAGAAWLLGTAALDARAGRRIAWALAGTGGGLAVFGLVQLLVDPSPTRIYFTVPLPEVGTPFGPFVNRNHFAGAMLLCAGPAVGLLGAGLAAARRGPASPGLDPASRPGRPSWRALRSAGLAAALLVAILVALAATTSRGGAAGACAGIVFLVACAPRGRRGRLILAAAAVVAAALLVLLAAGRLDDLLGRLFDLYGRWRNRFLVQADALSTFARFPVLGTGGGTFAEVYPAFQTVRDVRHFGNAHSDWAQFLMETGLLGAAAIAGVLVHAGAAAGRALRGPLREDTRFELLGPLSGLVAILVHGLVEVNLHVPSNALLAAAALSLAYAASVRARRDAAEGAAASSRAVRSAEGTSTGRDGAT